MTRSGGKGRASRNAGPPSPPKIVSSSATPVLGKSSSGSEDLPTPAQASAKAVRITALGGIGEIGRNMTVFEHKDRILIIDCGVLFPGSPEPGVDLILPDLRHIEDRMDEVEALVLTHAHEDHIGAIPYLLRLRPDLPIVGSKFTLALVAAKCREHRIRPKFIEVREGESSTHGPFECEYFAVNHSIPDALAIAVHTEAGTILHTGDIKLDQLPTDGRPTDLPGLSRLGDAGVDLALIDSTNSDVPGVGPSESEIGPTLDRLIGEAKQRVIIACFASNVYRVQQIIEAATQHGRRVAFVGRSMVRNMEIARELGFLDAPDRSIIDIDAASNLPGNQVVLVTTGTQGEPMAALSRMARGDHRSITIRENDLVILASSLVPGNEEAVFAVINGLAKIGARLITNQNARVHVSGHAFAGELLFLYNALRPRNVMPVHGQWRHLRANAALAVKTGVPEDRVVLAENGVVVDLVNGRAAVVGKVRVGQMYVDGLAMGDIGDATLEDRKVLGDGGFIAVTAVVKRTTGQPVSAPQVFARGFSDNPQALDPVVQLVADALDALAADGVVDTHRIAQTIRRVAGRWVAEKYRRKPMIVPTVVAVD
ncbi:MAG: ribonuclease J [Mycobacteriaceae bacterium]